VLVDARYHSADTNSDWQLSLLELLRIIDLYNTRSSTTRTGGYHEQSGMIDGFAAGPARAHFRIRRIRTTTAKSACSNCCA
jgi:hypothetical protein